MHLSPLGNNEGWTIEIKPPNSGNDYAYPLNPPLRFGNSQYLGTGYSESVKEQLSHNHVVYFVLNPSDYEKAIALAQVVLWPYYASAPDKTAEGYLAALPKFPSGVLILKPVKYETENGGKSVKWMLFSARVTTPSAFHLAPDLSSMETGCPAREAGPT